MKVFFMVVAAVYILYLLFICLTWVSAMLGSIGHQGPHPQKPLALGSQEIPQEGLAVLKEPFRVEFSGPWCHRAT